MLYHPSPHVRLVTVYEHHALESQPPSDQPNHQVTPIRVLRQDDFVVPILQADNHFLCVDKPAFLRIDAKRYSNTASDCNHEWTVERILQRQLLNNNDCGIEDASSPLSNITGLRQTHQLDANTSGVFLYAKHKLAASEACRLFQERKVQKTYLAILHGHVNIQNLVREAAAIDSSVQGCTNLGHERGNSECRNSESQSLRMDAWIQEISSQRCAVVEKPKEDGTSLAGKGRPQAASTILRLLLRTHFGSSQIPVTLVQLRPLTGRRHQLRVQCASLGHAIVGDWLYEENPNTESGRMFLHAFRLEMTFPDIALLEGSRKRNQKGKLISAGAEQPARYIWESAFPFAEALEPDLVRHVMKIL